jgi:hypothetical protein
LKSKTWRRSGVANKPKFEICASPMVCARRPVTDDGARSAAITAAAPPKKANGDAAIRP